MLIKCELLCVVDIELSVLTIFIFDSQIVVARFNSFSNSSMDNKFEPIDHASWQ